MWKPIYQPEPWPQYIKKKENAGVPLMEVRKKYMEEQILFENYVSNIQQLNVLSPSSGVSGGPSPSVVPPPPPSTPFVDVLDVDAGSGVEQWTFGFEDTWGWINPGGDKSLNWALPEDPNNEPAIWQVSDISVKPTCDLPYFEVEVGLQCPPSGIPSTGWNLGGNPCYTTFNVSNNPGGIPLDYSTSKVAQFNLVTGDATADDLPDGQLFTIDDVDLIMCPNLPTFDKGTITGFQSPVYRFPSGGAGAYIGLSFNGTVWEIAFDDPSTKGIVVLATGGDRRGFAGKTFTSTASATTPFTAVIDYP